MITAAIALTVAGLFLFAMLTQSRDGEGLAMFGAMFLLGVLAGRALP